MEEILEDLSNGIDDIGMKLKNVSLRIAFLLTADVDDSDERPFESWLSYSFHKVKRERDFNLRLALSTPPTWILEVPLFKRWREDGNEISNMLWLSGTTGYGKSVLAAYLTEELESQIPSSYVAYFFCKDMEGLSDVHNIVRTLAYQLALFSRSVWEELKQHWKNNKSVSALTAPVETLFQHLLQRPLTKLYEEQHNVYFVLDALNECPMSTRRNVAKVIRLLRSLSFAKVVITCQPVQQFQSSFQGVCIINLNKTHNAVTIKSYVIDQLNENVELAKRFESLQIDAVEFFDESYEGIFLWVTMSLQALSNAVSAGDFISILYDGPGDIMGLYERIFSRLKALPYSQKIWIQHLLCWLVVAKRSLLIRELQTGISLSWSIVLIQLVPDCPFNFPTLVGICGALLQVRDHVYDSMGDGVKPYQDVVLVHDSLRQFLINDNRSADIFYVNIPDAHMLVALACIKDILSDREWAFGVNDSNGGMDNDDEDDDENGDENGDPF